MIHEPAIDLLHLAAARGWNVAYTQGKDTGGSLYVSVEGRIMGADRKQHRFYVTWHTRQTGTFRLFSCTLGGADTSLKKVREHIVSEAHP